MKERERERRAARSSPFHTNKTILYNLWVPYIFLFSLFLSFSHPRRVSHTIEFFRNKLQSSSLLLYSNFLIYIYQILNVSILQDHQDFIKFYEIFQAFLEMIQRIFIILYYLDHYFRSVERQERADRFHRNIFYQFYIRLKKKKKNPAEIIHLLFI